MSGDDLLPVAGVGGAVACCLALELLGGAALLSGLTATVGLSAGAAYAAAVGIGGFLAALLAIGYTQIGGVARD